MNRDADHDLVISVSQHYYVASLTDLDISADRLRNENAQKTSDEIAACRGALGALQWLAIQTQPQLCARCNLLLAEVIRLGKMSYAMEIQRMIGEIRRESYELKFFKHKKRKLGAMFASSLWLTKLMQIETKVIRLVESSLMSGPVRL